ncbi:ABC transporter ATP-binding protein/permease [Nocardioides sambongensis]|uniref:ABC transporter ATP-binding protein/permease n=1 Tax=Nocardioides sambongensis TaxID=2589074 RepID=UPI001125C5E1|nr:dipeptide ABC transporter ATP-binding protein [Nocardioides sambongensis]
MSTTFSRIDGADEPLTPVAEGPPPGDAPTSRRAGPLRSLRHSLLRGRGLVGVILVGTVVALGLLAPLLAPYHPNEQIKGANLLGPSGAHWLGTDEVNRDVLSRTLYGIRADLVVVFAAVPIGAAIGILVGLVTSWWSVTDVIAQRFFDLLLAFPTLILAILLTAFFGPGLFTIGIVIVAVEIPVFGRLVRTSVRTVREMPFVEASQVVGAGPGWVLRRHVLPNSMEPLTVQLAVSMSVAVFIEGAMSFLGLGIRPPDPSLGSLIRDGVRLMYDAPFLAVGPSSWSSPSCSACSSSPSPSRRPVVPDPTHARPTHPRRTSASASLVAEPVLQIEHLAISFSHPRPAVEDISVTVRRGEVLALVGESGSGKSMTARAVLGLLPPGARATGSIRYGGTELLGLDEKGLDGIRGSEIAMVFQEPQTALNPVRTIGWQLKEALRAHGVRSRSAVRERSLELLAQVEIPEPEKRLGYYPHQLSGGQKQRVVLALALANEPALLLADEPTTALDVTVQAEVLRLLRRIRERTGTSIVLITHNMGVVAEIADRVLVLQAGNVVETGETRALFAAPREPYTRHLLGSVPRLPGRDEADTAPPSGATAVAALPAGEVEPPAVQFDGVHVRYGSQRRGRSFPAVTGVDLTVAAGEVVGLVGESGSGKTTLGRLAAGLVPLAGGTVRLGGQDLHGGGRSRVRALRRGLAFVHQDPEASLDPRFSIRASIREPLDVHRLGTRQARDARVEELLDAVQLPVSYGDRRPRELSGGQRQRVALARALALEPTLLVADEPTSALDVSVQATVLTLFADLQRELGFACLFISHDLAVVHQVAHRVAVLRAGRLVETGPVAEVFTRPRADYTRRLLDAVPVPDPARRGRRVRSLDDARAS